jgi:hypothetical protein
MSHSGLDWRSPPPATNAARQYTRCLIRLCLTFVLRLNEIAFALCFRRASSCRRSRSKRKVVVVRPLELGCQRALIVLDDGRFPSAKRS